MPAKHAPADCIPRRRRSPEGARAGSGGGTGGLRQPRLFHLISEDPGEARLIASSQLAAADATSLAFDNQGHLLSHMNLVALRLDAQGCVEAANEYALQVLGCTEGELQGCPVQGLISSITDSRGTRLPLRRLLAAPERHSSFQTQLQLHGKRRLWLKWTNMPVYDAMGEVAELIWVGMDITDLKQAEHGFVAYQRQLQTLAVHSAVLEARERQGMADAIHEDIAQDLAYWRMQLAALHHEQPAAAATNDMGRIVEGVGTLIQRLREFAVQLSPIILYRIGLKSAIAALAEQVAKRHDLPVEVQSDWLEEELPEEVGLVVYQAVRELLTNAATHAAATAVKVTLEGNGGELIVEVADDGIGFDPQILQAGHGKRGLGLMNLQQMLAHLRGRLLINSSPGQGSCLTVIVPHPRTHADLTHMVST